MNSASFIKSCPCCSSVQVSVTDHTVHRIICDKCGSHTRKGRMDEIITLWNEGRSEKDE